MSTTTWWKEGGVFLHSVRKMLRDNDEHVILGADEKPLWNDLTIRMNIPMAKDYLNALAVLLADVQTLPQQPTTEAPTRQ
jgi:hypothetical protein